MYRERTTSVELTLRAFSRYSCMSLFVHLRTDSLAAFGALTIYLSLNYCYRAEVLESALNEVVEMLVNSGQRFEIDL